MDIKKSTITELQGIPKTEIHLHIEAVTTAKTVWKLINKHKLDIEGVHNIEDLENKFKVNSLSDFIDLFINVIQASYRDPEDFKLLMDDLEDYLTSNNIVYAEVFVAPTSFLKNGFIFQDIMNVLVSGADRIFKEKSIDIKFIIDVSRGFGLENAMKNLDLTLEFNHPRIIGIGLGGAEKVGNAEDFVTVFDKAREHGLHLVAHAGEDADYKSINAAVDILKVERIGHGISAMENEECMNHLKELKIPLEVCPTSNLFTKAYVQNIGSHPIKSFFDKGIFVTVNSDDPTIFGSTLLEEYVLLLENEIFNKKEIGQLILNNLFATFMDKDKKDSLEIKIRETLNNKGYL